MKAQIRNHSTIARSFSVGKSFEGKHQAGVKIGTGPNHVVLHGLQHSREWITGSVVEFLIYQLLTGTDGQVAGYLKKCTFHIIPIMNPDGFIIIQTTDRLHRKNAQTEGKCLGTDRNLPPNYDSYLKPLADGTVKALAAVHETQFKVGDIYHTTYPASGSSIDYVMGGGPCPGPVLV
ncbi:hypothetical protein EC957_002972 [Mortierella hygrophila]|uniref:Peptidase M14 domain-containing protein n=1 Tax=Mortierella hygrophila TaxID=979708 RepID=A0A9P6F3H4_9FUNG|nr:hypothetical protein EC957_002972 [Mortierella hygrophila]